jgi:outer membrane receptor protein involved in Fe transport
MIGTDAADAVTGLPGLDDRFNSGQTAHDLYATYEHPFGRFDLMPGLRLEEVLVDTHQITQGVKDSLSYFEAYPTLHTSYRLSNAIQLTASYSRRVDRPDPSLLNPFRVYNNPLSFSEGDPALKPALTDSYEAAFEYGEKSVYYLVTAYFRDTHGLINQVTENLGDGVLLNTYGNIGRSWNTGLELVANGPITKTLSYSLTGDGFWNEVTDPDAPQGPPRAGAAFTLKPKLKWQPTKDDFFQLNALVASRSPTPQGYASGYVYLDLGYRHRFNDRLSLVAQLRDPTNAARTNVFETPTLTLRTFDRTHGRALSLGLTYDFGGKPKPAPKEIDFGSGGAPGR